MKLKAGGGSYVFVTSKSGAEKSNPRMKNKNSSQTLNLLRFEQVKSEGFIFHARSDFLRPLSELFLTPRYRRRLRVSFAQCNKHLYWLGSPNPEIVYSLTLRGCMTKKTNDDATDVFTRI